MQHGQRTLSSTAIYGEPNLIAPEIQCKRRCSSLHLLGEDFRVRNPHTAESARQCTAHKYTVAHENALSYLRGVSELVSTLQLRLVASLGISTRRVAISDSMSSLVRVLKSLMDGMFLRWLGCLVRVRWESMTI
jgi:hypothetical protein